MKTVILPTSKSNVVEANGLSSLHCYGVAMPNGERAFVTMDCTGAYTIRTLRNITLGSGTSTYNCLELDHLVQRVLHAGLEVRQFDTPEDLMEWLMWLTPFDADSK